LSTGIRDIRKVCNIWLTTLKSEQYSPYNSTQLSKNPIHARLIKKDHKLINE